MKLLGRHRAADADPNAIDQRNLDASLVPRRRTHRGRARLCRRFSRFLVHLHSKRPAGAR
jgi:hypothetical protein